MIQAEATFSISTYFHLNNPYNSNTVDFNTAPNYGEALKILSFSDAHQGVIDYDFLDWALEADISYESIEWFATKVCNNCAREIISTIRTLFLKYKMFFDETSNCIKYRFKGVDGHTNSAWYNDFVVGGIAYLNDVFPINVDDLFAQFKMQKSALADPKLKHIAEFSGEDPSRFLNILKSKNVSLLLKSLYNADNVFIHWSSQNLLFYSLVDIIDSISDNPFYNIHLKNLLYDAASKNQDIMELLARYDYPNIKEYAIKEFCKELKLWFIKMRDSSAATEYGNWNYLISKIATVHTKEELLFITDNEDYLLIENFVPLYSSRIQIFANSELYFDECGIVQDNIYGFVDVLCPARKNTFEFRNSKNDRLISLSDMIVGITGAFQAYINTHGVNQIIKDISKLSNTQRENLRMFIKLRLKSSLYDMHFDHGSIIENSKIKYELINNLLGIDKKFIKQ
ncbi:hypothetical protein RASY3_13290 [Ruminococcus albus SY3]|uniref:Uncharacterized protein n=1 Tax=Ruminococcus albus SY3 TaxID=1341156 RepID=A0A011WN45_RUMAL|nr:hypothetical protein [Ruminococcus albus]EXM38435.1 hypothetical protein RASY3_13290 [Ruminococcus albus SY3]